MFPQAPSRSHPSNAGIFISFEGTEGAGKSTQITRLANRLAALGNTCQVVREPGGTPIGEEIRHTLKHSPHNAAMTAEAELLLFNASRAQLVREVLRPALSRGDIVLCDRFFDSTLAYQGYGRGLDLNSVRAIVEFAVQETIPDITFLLELPLAASEERRRSRAAQGAAIPDRMEEADQEFFRRVERGFQALANAEPDRIKRIDATATMDEVEQAIWSATARLLELRTRESAHIRQFQARTTR